MKPNDILHGFRIVRSRPLPEIDAVMWEMVYEKNGAELIYLEREDTNKTFAITFKTPPQDSTGVFHIIEHSVLCGSSRYPVKDPFVELLKGSMQTFLNAFTYPDKTMYPVCSRNETDFLNLMDVYMDAVFHPLFCENPNIFRQEGWHYELEPSEPVPTYNGVVFNEMKGAYSSADAIASEQIKRIMLPDTCYAFDSGGDPTAIPDLTYEQFLAAHARYYHPSAARIVLDGTMDLDKVLERIDSFLAPYDRQEIDTEIPMQKPLPHRDVTCEYEIAETEKEEGRVRFYSCYGGYRFDEIEKQLAVAAIANAMCDSNESPLKRALLSRGLCENVYFNISEDMQQSYVYLEVLNTDEEKIPQIRRVIDETLGEQIEQGIDREQLVAVLNRMEFRMRERNAGAYPSGLSYAMDAFSTWLYGGDPARGIVCDDVLRSLRDRLDSRYFEDVLHELFFENSHTATLTMYPSRTLAARRREAEEARLAAARDGWSAQTVEQILAENRAFAAWQQTPDSPEAVASIPMLALSDIDPLPERIVPESTTCNDVRCYHHTIASGGILYATMHFDVSDLTLEEIPLVRLFAALLTTIGTRRHDTLTLKKLIDSNIGSLYVTMIPVPPSGDTPPSVEVLVVLSCLESCRQKAVEVLGEVLNETDFTQKEQVLNCLRQLIIAHKESIVQSGNSTAVTRAGAYLTGHGVVAECSSGYSFYRQLQEWESGFSDTGDALCQKLAELADRFLRRERLWITTLGKKNDSFVSDLVAQTRTGTTPCTSPTAFQPLGLLREGIVIPSQVAYAVQVGMLPQMNYGQMVVAKRLISLEYFWEEIRLRGGAYGGGMVLGRDGGSSFYSYRDPSPQRSIVVYRDAAKFLREFAASDRALDKYIIGAIASSEPPRSPIAIGMYVDTLIRTGATYEDRCHERREMLQMKKEDLLQAADAIQEMIDRGAICVVGSKEQIAACGDLLCATLTL